MRSWRSRKLSHTQTSVPCGTLNQHVTVSCEEDEMAQPGISFQQLKLCLIKICFKHIDMHHFADLSLRYV